MREAVSLVKGVRASEGDETVTIMAREVAMKFRVPLLRNPLRCVTKQRLQECSLCAN